MSNPLSLKKALLSAMRLRSQSQIIKEISEIMGLEIGIRYPLRLTPEDQMRQTMRWLAESQLTYDTRARAEKGLEEGDLMEVPAMFGEMLGVTVQQQATALEDAFWVLGRAVKIIVRESWDEEPLTPAQRLALMLLPPMLH